MRDSMSSCLYGKHTAVVFSVSFFGIGIQTMPMGAETPKCLPNSQFFKINLTIAVLLNSNDGGPDFSSFSKFKRSVKRADFTTDFLRF